MNRRKRAPPGAQFQPLERRRLFADGAIDVIAGDGAARSISFIDPDGTAVVVSTRGGSATLHFTGDAPAQTATGRTAAVTGTNLSLAAVTFTGASRRTVLSIKASGGDGRFTLGGVTADGPLRRIDAPQAVLTGTLSTAGPVGGVRLLRTENATIMLGGGDWSSVEITEAAVDTDLASAGPIRRLLVNSWTGAERRDTITAPSIAKALVTGTFTGDMSLGSADSLKIRYLLNATITLSGDVGSATFGSLNRSSVYAGILPSPTTTPFQQQIYPSDFVAPSTIGRLRVDWVDEFSTSLIAARTIGSVSVGRIGNDGFSEHRIIADWVGRVRGRRTLHFGQLRPVKSAALGDHGSFPAGPLLVMAL